MTGNLTKIEQVALENMKLDIEMLKEMLNIPAKDKERLLKTVPELEKYL